jgi:hypothetical protein
LDCVKNVRENSLIIRLCPVLRELLCWAIYLPGQFLLFVRLPAIREKPEFYLADMASIFQKSIVACKAVNVYCCFG